MNRLTTNKKLDSELFKNIKDINIPENKYFLKVSEGKTVDDTIELATDKLGRYEDIEEELGIDLITLFKALHSEKIYFKEQKYRKGKISYFKRFNLVKGTDNILRIIGEVKEQYTRNNYGCEFGIILDLNDYGKTWALTKEELEK